MHPSRQLAQLLSIVFNTESHSLPCAKYEAENQIRPSSHQRGLIHFISQKENTQCTGETRIQGWFPSDHFYILPNPHMDLPTFTPFPRLPTELRIAIWRAALPYDIGITKLHIHQKSIAPCLVGHALFCVNRESRTEAFAVLRNTPPPYNLPAEPQGYVMYLDPRTWNDIPPVSAAKAPMAAIVESDRAQRFVASAMMDSDGGRFDSVSVDMRYYLVSSHQTDIFGGPLDFRGRPLRIKFFCFARTVGRGRRGGEYYVNSADAEDGMGLGGRKGQGPNKPVLRVVYVIG